MIHNSATAQVPRLTPARFIRETVFGYRTQQEFADALRYTQAQISRFEGGMAFSSEAQERIRELAKNRAIAWDNNWFFEVPKTDQHTLLAEETLPE